MAGRVTTRVVEPVSVLTKRTIEMIVARVNRALYGAALSIVAEFQALVRTAIMAQPEYSSILSGKLREEFGIPDGQSKLDVIIKTWTDSISAKIKPMRTVGMGVSSGGLIIGAFREDWSDVLSLPEATQETEKPTFDGKPLRWLEWLLLLGDKVIIKSYKVGVGSRPGRAGGKIMLQSVSQSWSVPPEYSGTSSNNFVTRALESIVDELSAVTQAAIITRF